MKQFIQFVLKEFRHIFRDARTMMILLLMPIIQILLFGFAITTEIRNANIAVLAPKNDVLVNRVIERFDASPYFTVKTILHQNSEIEPLFLKGGTSLVVVFNEDNSAVQFVADGAEPNQANMVVNYAKGILASQLQEIASQQTQPGMDAPKIATSVRMLYNPQQKGAYNFVPGVMGLILMLICAMMTSIAIVREKEQGTMETLLASPLPPVTIVLAKLVPYFTLSIVNIGTILILSVFVLDVPIVGSLPLLIGICLLFVFLALSFGLLISTLVETQMAAMLISGMVMMMPTMLLSGMMFPIESMPEILQWISCVVPVRWFISAVKKVMLQGCTFADILQEFSIICGMIFLVLTVSLKKFKLRLE